jgi:uncharacterized protein
MKKSESSKDLCRGCTICCEHVAIEIDTPRSKEDFQHIIWYVLHENILVFKDHDNKWFIEFKTKCGSLDNEGLCKIYLFRPNICRDYSHKDCERYAHGKYYKIILKTRKDVLNYVKKHTIIKNFS